MKCPQCSFENEDGAAFCENCGEVFPAVAAPARGATAEVPVIDIPEVKTPSTDPEVRGEVLSDVPPVLKVPDISTEPAPKPHHSTVADLVRPVPEAPAEPDFSGFERLVDSSYVPPAVSQAGDTAEIPRITGDYVPRARSYAMGLTEKELRRRDRQQKKMAKKFSRMQEKEEMRRAKEALKAEKERLRAEAAAARADQAPADDDATAVAAGLVLASAASVPGPEGAEDALIEGASAIVVRDQAALTAAEAATGETGEVALAPREGVALETAGAGELASAATAASAGETAVLKTREAASATTDASAPASAEPSEKSGTRKAAASAAATTAFASAKGNGAGEKAAKKDKSAKKSKAAKSSGRPAMRRAPLIAAACVVLALAVAGTAWGTYNAEIWGGKTIPDVVGLSQEEATAALGERGFAVEAADEKSDMAPGTVLAASPDQGTRAAEGSTVSLTVAVPHVVPEVLGLTQQEAADALAAEGLGAISVIEQKSNDAEGTVLSVAPEAGTEVLSTDEITLTVAVPYTVPDVTGLGKSDATDALEAEGYTVDTHWSYSEDVEEGTVLYTEPEAGTEYDTGQEVVVYLAKSRANELVARASEILPGARLKSGDDRYIIDEVKSVEYAGDDVVKYTCIAHKYEDVTLPFGLGTQRYEDTKQETLEGTLTFDSDNEVTTADPSISYS
ncbi:MAG: PASTA domain-containing protein [Adlercreutzia sp.]|uniref:PASTA domain-containing protein n=1 Tax=uncultured Adlercreutzia sp. TaxID=875803 RepID=UPI00216CD299|nr:PASTA domain-containing protein [uncultured Adlercreutzia sp.]MCI8424917.1 PASTA domain-containing protein [Adlercreutzia sp.]